jgi:hypothetical protein
MSADAGRMILANAVSLNAHASIYDNFDPDSNGIEESER